MNRKHSNVMLKDLTLLDFSCGKPYGYKQRDYFGTTISVVNAALLDAAALPAYPQGIAPTCRVKDLIVGPEGGDYDLVFQAAVHYAQQGKCQ